MAERRFTVFGGNLTLPVGYTFCPTDDVFVAHYLKKKAFSQRRNNDVEVVPEYDVFSSDPRNLPSGGRIFLGNKYFFMNLKEYVIAEDNKRPAGLGEWRTAGGVKAIFVANNRFVGKRNKLQYWRRVGERFIRTRWIMHEYRIFLPTGFLDPNQMSPWAGYKIFLRNEVPSKRARNASDTENDDSDHIDSEEEEEEDINEGPTEINLAGDSNPPSPSSSDSDSDSLAAATWRKGQ